MDGKKELWNSQQKLLKSIITKLDKFDETIELGLGQHLMVHASEMSQANVVTFEDELWDGLDEITFRTMPTEKDEATIAWCLWHTTRIEDITMNILVADDTQVINSNNWLEKMNVTICDTGNAMTNKEIVDFSSNIDMQELRNYRKAVGRKTREIIKRFEPSDLKRKMEASRLQRVLDEGGVLNVEGANWLIDFWGKKNVAGILLMPVTRHHIVHINESIKLKEKCRKLAKR
ncbi:DinB family protein [Clostridium sp. OS1-26]|uniref:DinB family protein n=1 Tax=Clostridium sp. OS1-26 TaxID=3070681 RepID=UPI0027E0905B|nr:DinB family protein [Clostridium sp. OS1-26]WML32819.1 DinB family protein [Clostridium sp. OS1-26]